MQKYKDELKTKKRKKLLAKAVSFSIFIIVGAAGIIYLLFFARLMDVRNVNIETAEEMHGLNGAVEDWLSKGFWRLDRRSNMVFLSGDGLASWLLGQFPELESVRITKKFPHTLVVSGKGRKLEGVWCLTDRERCFYFDKNGIAFSETQPSSGFLILNVIDQRVRELQLGEKVTTDDWLRNIIEAKVFLTKNEINIAGFIIPADLFDEFHARTAEGWKILFSNQTNIESQISALATFFEEKLTAKQRAGLQYVDLRIQNRIYYK